MPEQLSKPPKLRPKIAKAVKRINAHFRNPACLALMEAEARLDAGGGLRKS